MQHAKELRAIMTTAIAATKHNAATLAGLVTESVMTLATTTNAKTLTSTVSNNKKMAQQCYSDIEDE